MAENKNCLVQFKYKCKDVKYDRVGLVGGLDILKKWDINDPVFLTYNEKEKLFILNEISLPQNVLIEYKYVFYHNNQKIWEKLPNNSNRKIELKDPSSIIHDNEDDPIPLITKPISPPQKPSKPKTRVKKRSSRKASDNKPIPPMVSISIPIYQPQKKNNEIDNLDVLDYNSDEWEDKDKEKEDEQKIRQIYTDVNKDDDIIMISFNLPFDPVKENGSFSLKLTNSPLFHILYKVIENEKNIKWFGSLRNERNYTKEEKDEIAKMLKEKNMYLINVDPEIYEKTKILFNRILEPLCHYITLDENDMDIYVNFSEYWKEYKKYIDSVCSCILPFISKQKKTLIFLHDYYYYLFPSIFINKCNHNKEYQEMLSNISMGLYIHIPFPSHEIFKRIPAREEIITSLIKCQVLGFHTFDHSRNFLKTSKRLLGANFVSTIHGDLAANYMENTALIRVKNITPEIDLIKEYQKDPKFQEKYNEITNKYKGKIIFLAMDHLYFPITIKNKLVAYKRFLANNAERAKKIVLIMIIRDNLKTEEKKT